MELKMDSEDEERLTALGLALDLTNNDRKTLDDDPSAGANAGSCACVTSVAANPLSEIVWSPHKGLCLKCAECSFPDRRHLLPKGVDSQGANRSLQDIEKNNLVGLEQGFEVKGNSTRGSTSDFLISRTGGAVPFCLSSIENNTGTGGNILEMKADAAVSPSLGSPEVETVKDEEMKDGQGIHKMQTGVTLEAMEQPKPLFPGHDSERSVGVPNNEMSPGNTDGEFKNVASNNMGMGIIPCTEASPTNEDKVCHNPGFSPRIRTMIPASSLKEEAIEKDITCHYGLPLAEKLESTDENDVQTGKSENGGTIAPGSSPVGNRGIIIKVAEIEAKEKHVPDSNAPSNARICKLNCKGKEKALSDSDINGRTLEEDDDSHESVESCNSAGLFSVGKRRLGFEQQLIVRNKRAKQIQDNPSSSSYSKRDSSFMNWISNMMKGFTRQNQDESCSLALSLSNPDVGGEHLDPTLNRGNKNIDCLHGEIGFKSIFQSIYCPSKNYQDAHTSFPGNQAREGPMETELASRFDINVGTIMSTEEINPKNEDTLKSNKVSSEFHLGNEAGPHALPQSPYANMNSSQDIRKMHSGGNMSSNILQDGREKGVVNKSTSSLAELEPYKVEYNSSPSADNINHLAYGGDPLKSLWIARFSAKSSSSVFKQDIFNIGRHGDVKASYTQLSSGLHMDEVTPEVKQNHHEQPSHVLVHELQNYVITNEASSFGFKRLEFSHDPAMIQTTSHTRSSQKLKSSEVMASVFARRLDALRNIHPSDQADDAIRATTSCFFCGMKGHHPRTCSEITETEMEELLKKVNSHESWEESPRLCIRCLQLNHWAVACPNMPPKLHQLEDHAPTSQPFSLKKFTIGSARREVSISENTFSRTNLVDKDKQLMLGSQTDANEARELPISAKGKNPEVPKGIFDAIKLLRLSRTDIFKWMNSQISISQLDGFFLRLRLGKWEKGLGGTGYYVACITGMQKERLMKDAKNPISVNVGGIKCVVESQYISNHDFREDELMAWWCTTSQGGGKIPSEEELKSKVEEKKMLGF